MIITLAGVNAPLFNNPLGNCAMFNLTFKCYAVTVFMTCVMTLSAPLFSAEKIESNTRLSEVANSQLLRINAERWRITPEEYTNFEYIMQGPLGKWNPTIDPLLALGIYADTEVEQQRYAELYAQQEYALTVKTQAFERAYQEAFRRLYPDATIIANELMQKYHQHQKNKKGKSVVNANQMAMAVQASDRIVYFARLDCNVCQADILRLQKTLTERGDVAVDIYLPEKSSQEQARQWANNYRIDPKLVEAKRLTINIDDGTYFRLQAKSKIDTSLYLSRGNKLYAIDPLKWVLTDHVAF